MEGLLRPVALIIIRAELGVLESLCLMSGNSGRRPNMRNCGCCRRPRQAQFFGLILVLFLAENICQAQSNQSTGDQLSYTSLQLKILRNDAEIGTATGFVVMKNNKPYLLTNRHVVLACALDKDPSDVGGWICANKLAILHNKHGHLGEWFWVMEDLFDAQRNK